MPAFNIYYILFLLLVVKSEVAHKDDFKTFLKTRKKKIKKWVLLISWIVVVAPMYVYTYVYKYQYLSIYVYHI